MNIPSARDRLQQFDFRHLFVESLGWGQPTEDRLTSLNVGEQRFQKRQTAHLSGVKVFEILCEGGVPEKKTRFALQKEIAKDCHENLLIFVDKARTQCLWTWLKRDDDKISQREH